MATLFIPADKEQVNFIKNPFTLNPAPGDTVILQGLTRSKFLTIYNFQGTLLNPITITIDSSMDMITDFSYSLQLSNCKHIIINGKNRKWRINGSGKGLGVVLTNFSSNIRIEGLEIFNTNFTGIMAKTDPICPGLINGVQTPTATRANSLLDNITINNCYIHDTGKGEGMYIGYTFPTRNLTCNGVLTTVQSEPTRNIVITNNLVIRTGSDGIQVSQCESGLNISNNTIIDHGVNPFGPFQDSGIALGNNNKGIVKDNFIKCHPTLGRNSISIIGSENILVEGNTLIHKGIATETNKTAYAVYADEQNNPFIINGNGIQIRKNRIKTLPLTVNGSNNAATANFSIHLRTNRVTNQIQDNLIENPLGKFVELYPNVTTSESNNLKLTS